MPGHQPLTLRGISLLSMLLFPCLASCSSNVAVEPPEPPSDVADRCQVLVAALPDQLYGEDAREIDPPSPFTAAWGDPAITLRCGVGVPDSYEPTAELVTVNEVDWYPEQSDDGYIFTTWGRTVGVEVSVPSDYAPEANPLTDLADVIEDTVPR